MTHDTDCRVLDEYRDTIDRIAELFWNEKEIAAHDLCLDLGWVKLGRGEGRVAYRVSDGEDSEYHAQDATSDAPCVVKFATKADRFDGQWQNRVEVGQYEQFPAPLREGTEEWGGVPAVVPIRDYQRGEYLWVSQPEINAEGGSEAEVEKKFAQYGWFSPDIHGGNVGEMHGESVLLDYGVEFDNRPSPKETAGNIETLLEEYGCRGVDAHQVEGHVDTWEVTFLPPEWVLEGGPPVEKSVIPVDDRSEITAALFTYGAYKIDPFDDDLQDDAAAAAQAIEELWGVDVTRSASTEDGVSTLEFYIEFYDFEHSEMHRRGPDDHTVVDIYKQLTDQVHKKMPGGEVEPLPVPAGGNHTSIVERDEYTMQFGGFDVEDLMFGIDDSALDFYLDVSLSVRPGVVGEYGGADVDIDAVGPDGMLWGNASVEFTGLPGDEDDINGTFLYHFFVNPDYRRMGVGRAMFDVFLATAAWTGGVARGKFGQDEMESHAFLEGIGVDPQDIHQIESSAWIGDSAVGFSFDPERFIDRHDFIRVEVDMDRPDIGREIDEAVIGSEIDEAVKGESFGNPFESTGYLEDDLVYAAEEGESVVEEVVDHYDGRKIKEEGPVTYYTARDPRSDEMKVVYLEDEHVAVWDADRFIYDMQIGDLFDFIGVDMYEEFNDRFWNSPDPLYHATDPESAELIFETGELQAMNQTRGLGNRSVGRAVFTSDMPEDWMTIYGEVLLEIDTEAMKDDGFTPVVEREPQIVEGRAREAAASKIGFEDFYVDYPHDVDHSTVIVYADIPEKYLAVVEGEEELDIGREIDREVMEEDQPFRG